LALDRFREFATQQGVTEFDAFSAQLNLSGEITFFSRNPIYHPETAELNDWVILKPAWLLQRISAVLTDEAARKSSAFVKKDLVRIWPDDPKFIRDFLARVMEHFDLAYHVDDQDGRHIVVELAPEDRPAAVAPRWDEWLANASFEKIALHYKFPIAIPPGLPTWFTARAHSYTTPERHWRRGAFLTDSKGNAALIEAELNNRMVKLEVPGPVPLEFFTKLRICFEETVNRFPGLQQTVKEHVPCVKPTCPGFDRQTLELEYKEGERHIRCQASDCRAKHEIAALLYGLSRSREEQTVAAILDELGKLQQEFNMLTAREQSRYDSRCPSLFTLEFERLAKLLPSVVEDMWEHLTDKPTSAQLTIWCQHPGECHAVKTYLIEPPGRRLAELVPLMKKAHAIIGAAAPIISAMYPLVKAPNFKDLADTWTDKVSGPLQLLRESVGDPERAYGVALVALRQILTEVAPHEIDRWGGLRQVLLLKSQYLWVCEEHARHPDYRG
jgi:internalin A